MAREINDSEFKELISSSKPVLVDFWAPWCGPCRQLSPVISELAEEIKDKVEVVKLNIDENPEAPTQYDVRSIPALMLFQNGQLIATKVGSAPKSNLAAWIEENI